MNTDVRSVRVSQANVTRGGGAVSRRICRRRCSPSEPMRSSRRSTRRMRSVSSQPTMPTSAAMKMAADTWARFHSQRYR